MHAIRNGQVRWVAKGDPVAQRQIIHAIFAAGTVTENALARIFFLAAPGEGAAPFRRSAKPRRESARYSVLSVASPGRQRFNSAFPAPMTWGPDRQGIRRMSATERTVSRYLNGGSKISVAFSSHCMFCPLSRE